jgi:hypothetical protein
MRLRRHAAAVREAGLQHRGVPAASRLPGRVGTGGAHLGPRASWRCGQWAGAAGGPLSGEAGQTPQQEPVTVSAPGVLPQAPHGGALLDAPSLGLGQENLEALPHAQGATGRSLLQRARAVLARAGTAGEGTGPGGYRLRRTPVAVSAERHAVSLATCPVYDFTPSGSRIVF